MGIDLLFDQKEASLGRQRPVEQIVAQAKIGVFLRQRTSTYDPH